MNIDQIDALAKACVEDVKCRLARYLPDEIVTYAFDKLELDFRYNIQGVIKQESDNVDN